MMKKLYFLLFTLLGCVPIQQSSTIQSENGKTLQLSDLSYEPQIKTVRLSPLGVDSRAQLLPAVVQLGTFNLLLQFDDLRDQRENYYARIIHCNQDWTKSTLADLDYMTEYNEFPINTFEFSLDTHHPYVQYKLRLPAVKLPGNYVVLVYRNGDKNDIILTRRFMVYDQRLTFMREGNLMGPGALASSIQQLNFTINYKKVPLINPLETVNVTVRQNQRWDNLMENIKPSFVRENIQELEYRFFDVKNIFKGINQFRFFDLRSLNYPGRNVLRVDKTQQPYQVYIQPDKSRNGQPYALYDDMNGNFSTDNYDTRNVVAGNYADVHFSLLSPEPINGDVYLSGAFTNWTLSNEYKMTYDAIKKEYNGTVFLKQGWYDYQYVVKSNTLPSYYFEGTHFETENQYEVFVYYRSFQPQADLLIGYIPIVENPQAR
ncbi:MAG TPA: type IX secretion system plug protein domain-containing protein [Cyclobacteriaceae bacterium]|nr:type IX secretion system plug protein domain-containing protein [Cyclobacteriaceae bacterium]